MTIRKQIIELLETRALSLREISLELRLKEKEVAEHLEHVARSLAPARRIKITPARCQQCDYIFRKRSRFSTPGKCPLCRSQRIDPAEFKIEDR